MVSGTDYVDTLEARLDTARRLLRSEDPAAIVRSAEGLAGANITLLYGYVRSFVRLSYNGNVDDAAQRLGLTRPTVQRHIVELENLLEVPLFERIGRSSKLTNMGVLWLPRAEEFLNVGAAFIRGERTNKASYRSTQLPFRALMSDESSSALLKSFAEAWLSGARQINAHGFQAHRSRCIIYQRQYGKWAALEINAESALAQWFGADRISASVGKPISEIETGDELQDEISFQLDRLYVQGGLLFSEIACNLHHPSEDARRPALYQRLLAEMVDEHDQPAIASMIAFIDPLPTGR